MKLKDLLKLNIPLSVVIIFLTLLGSISIAYKNYILSITINALIAKSWSKWWLFTFLEMITDILGHFLKRLGIYLFSKQSQAYIHQIRYRITENYFSKTDNISKVSTMQNRLTNDLNMLYDLYLTPTYRIWGLVCDIIFSSTMIFTFNPFLLALTFILAIILLFVPKILSNSLQKATTKISVSNSTYLNTLEKWLSGLAILQRYNVRKKLLTVLSDSSAKLEQATVTKEKKVNELETVNMAANMIAQMLVDISAGILVLTGQLNIGLYFSLGNYSSVIFSELGAVTSRITQVQSTKSLRDSVSNSYSIIPKNNQELSKSTLDNFAAITINNLSLQFPNAERLEYPDFTINAGEKVLLSGDSGTGKSTLLKLILGEIIPSTGTITFKDKNGNSLQPNLSQIGYVPQEAQLFPGTIEENITMFNSQLDRMASAWAEKMQLSADLNKFPAGIHTAVNLNKENLSGGQKQKIVLARTETYDNNIILIDEGTSAIDSNATQKILKNILSSNSTVIFIAHNLTPQIHQMFDHEIHLKNPK